MQKQRPQSPFPHHVTPQREDYEYSKNAVYYDQTNWEEKFFSNKNFRRLWCCIGIGMIVLGIYLTTLFSLFYFASREYNSLFQRVLDLESDIRDQTSLAIQNFNDAADKMSGFNSEHPQMLNDLQGTMRFLSSISENIDTNMTFSRLNNIAEDTVRVLHMIIGFIEENKNLTQDATTMLQNGKNFTIFLEQLQNKFTHW